MSYEVDSVARARQPQLSSALLRQSPAWPRVVRVLVGFGSVSAVSVSIRIFGSVNFRFGPEHSDLLINVGQNRQLVIAQKS